MRNDNNNSSKISQMAAYRSTDAETNIKAAESGSQETVSGEITSEETASRETSSDAVSTNDMKPEPTDDKTEISGQGSEAKKPVVRTVAGVSVVDAATENLDMPVPETKKDKFFRIMDTFGDMVFLNIAFAVSCVPIITIGAAFTALYTETLKMVKKEEGKVLPDYFKAFKKNLIPGTKAWVLVLLYLYLIYVEYAFMKVVEGSTYNVLLIAIGIELLLLSFTLPLLFPLIARYENKTLSYFKNSLVLSLQRPSIWARVYISWLGPAFITLLVPKVFYYGWYAWVFILCSLFAYSSSLIIRQYFDELEAKQNRKQ